LKSTALENKVYLRPISAVLSEDFRTHKNYVVKIFVDASGTFCPVFTFSIASCYNTNYRSVEFRYTML